MRLEDIINYIDNPDLLNDQTLPQLGGLVEEYPYFQTVRLLYLINLHLIKDLNYAPELRKMACYAGDRQKLFYLIEEKKFAPLNINLLENSNDNLAIEAPFSLVDFFLADIDLDKPENNDKSEKGKAVGVSNDYISYILSAGEFDDLESAPMQHQEVIDRFLEEDEKAPIKITLKENNDSEITELPVTEPDLFEDNGFFSETLVKIYLKQRKYEKALEIIRKLNLRYPEKNIYFADQIRFLEKLIINIKKT